MKVKVLFFGATADSVGKREVELVFDENTLAEKAFSRIFERFPALANNHQRKSLLFAINQEYANGNEFLKNGDELAIFTAVSGG